MADVGGDVEVFAVVEGWGGVLEGRGGPEKQEGRITKRRFSEVIDVFIILIVVMVSLVGAFM